MGLEMPGFITEPLGWIGMTWPEADEEKLFEAGQTWLNFGNTLRSQADQANSTAQKIPSEHQGDAIDDFTTWWNAPDGPGKNLPDNAAAAELIGAALIAMAAITLALKIAFIAQLVILAIEVAQAIATAFATFGATTAEIPGFVAATRAICREALNKVISMVEREIAELFSKAAKLFEKVGAKDLAKGADKYAEKFTAKAQERMFQSLFSKAGRVDVGSPPDGAHFYSGRYKDAEGNVTKMRQYAEEATDGGVNSTTLEQTQGGKLFDDMGLYREGNDTVTEEQANQIWGRLSERYAQGTSGEVTSYVHDPWEKSIWLTRERQALIDNPDVTRIKVVDPITSDVSYPKGAP